MDWLGYSSREALEASGILDKWAQQQQQQSSLLGLGQASQAIHLCPRCQGHRLERVLYNSMVLEQNCPECDGEGVVRSALPSSDARGQVSPNRRAAPSATTA